MAGNERRKSSTRRRAKKIKGKDNETEKKEREGTIVNKRGFTIARV